MKKYEVGQVYYVRTPYNHGVYKVSKIEGDQIWYKAATPYLDSPPFHVNSNFSEKSELVEDLSHLKDEVVERLNQITV